MSRNKKPSTFGAALLNLISALILLGGLCVGSMAVFIFTNPGVLPAVLQPLPTVPVILTLAPPLTLTPTQRPILPPTWTPVPPTHTPTVTNTPLPTNTPAATATPTEIPEGGEDSRFAYVLQGEPIPLRNFTRPELACSWMGVGGQVFDLSGAPVTQLEVHLGGTLARIPLSFITLTGLATQYGPGGFEFSLAEAPVASQETLYIQLIDQSGLPLSDKIFFDTFADCDKALLLINFKQIK